jgi:hypothetical protein
MAMALFKRAMVIMLAVSIENCFGLSLIYNGSFEADTGGISDIKVKAPQFWDVNVPSKFSGVVGMYDVTDGKYDLQVYANRNTAFNAGEKAFVSQEVDLSDANQIIFDVRLLSYKSGIEGPWDPNKWTAFVQIDDNVVWESNSTANGLSRNVTLDVNETYKDSSPHILSMGIKANSAGTYSSAYWTIWDFVKFDTYCGGRGYLGADFNHDCWVDMTDLVFLADTWLDANTPAGEYRADMAADGQIDFADFAVLAQQWLSCTDWAHSGCKSVQFNYLWHDYNEDGIVNFEDFALMPADANMAYMDDFTYEWLEKNWLYRLKTNDSNGLP